MGTHRTVTVAGLRGRLKRMEAKAFNVHMPQALHAAVKALAQEHAAAIGGQANMNKVIVQRLYESMKDRLTEDEQAQAEHFISLL